MARTRAIATAVLLAAIAVTGCAGGQSDQRTITFDLIQCYWGDDATREAAKDHQESPPPTTTTSATSAPGCAPCPCAPTPPSPPIP